MFPLGMSPLGMSPLGMSTGALAIAKGGATFDDSTLTLTADDRVMLGGDCVAGFEDEPDFEALLSHVVTSLRPRDMIEKMYMLDIVRAYWDARRARRAIETGLSLGWRDAIDHILSKIRPGVDPDCFNERSKRRELTAEILRQGVGAHEGFRQMLADRGLDETAVTGAALAISLAEVERLDRLATMADSRRVVAMRELRSYRAALARELEAFLAGATDEDLGQ
jgi:hypothetical protein